MMNPRIATLGRKWVTATQSTAELASLKRKPRVSFWRSWSFLKTGRTRLMLPSLRKARPNWHE
jgi:hypothetical protein